MFDLQAYRAPQVLPSVYIRKLLDKFSLNFVLENFRNSLLEFPLFVQYNIDRLCALVIRVLATDLEVPGLIPRRYQIF
jgi:hypothetical protein